MFDLILKKKKMDKSKPRIEVAEQVFPSKKVVIDGKEMTVREIKQITDDAIIAEDLQGNIVVIPIRKVKEDVSNVRAVLL